MSKKLKNLESIQLNFSLDGAVTNEEQRYVTASLSSEQILAHGIGPVKLRHNKDAIDLSRAKSGLPLLFNHDTDKFIGEARNVEIVNGRTLANLHFSHNDLAEQVWQDVKDGFLKNTSITAKVKDYQFADDDNGNEYIDVTNWLLVEASVVPVPRDASVGINRAENLEGNEMTDTTEAQQKGTGAGPGSDLDVIQLSEVARRKEREKGAKLERDRQNGINDLFSDFLQYDGAEDIQRDCLTEGRTVEQSRETLLRFLGGRSEPTMKPLSEPARRRSATIVDDGTDKWTAGITEALEVRFGIETDQEKIKQVRGTNEFLSFSLMDMARDYLRRNGESLTGKSVTQIAGMSLKRHGVISHTSSDFTDVLANVANKSVMVGYEQNAETWRPIVRIGTLSDYKQAARVGLTSFTDLDRLTEAAEYKHGTTSDVRENITMRKYGKLFSITREAILNDDQDTFARIPRMMGKAAARVVGDLVYDEILLGNPTLNQDSTALFHADHNNLVAAGSGAAPSVTTLDAATLAMRTQTDPDANSTLNVQPQFLIVPAALEATALALTTAIQYDTAPGATSGRQEIGSVNRYASLTPIVEPRIDANDSAKWFLSASPTMYDTIEVAFLNGQESPYMEQQDGFSQDGVTYKIRLEATAAAMGYVGLYFNDGN